MDRTTCRACDTTALEFLLELGPQPLAGGFLPPDPEIVKKEVMHPLPICICRSCGLVQTPHVISAEVLFTDYFFSSSTIGPLVTHFKDYAGWLKQRFDPKLVVEMGCNDGILLDPLRQLGIKACGVDISENISKLARDKGLTVITGFFNEATAATIEAQHGKADVITASNCFPHNDDPSSILRAARQLLKPTGHLCLEVMYAGDLLEFRQWDSMYHEHLSYYCLQTLDTLLKRHGFYVVDAERLPMHAGSLRVTAAVDPNEIARPSLKAIMDYESRLRITDVDIWKTFFRDIQRRIQIVRDVFAGLAPKSRIWGYGASGRASMWVNACSMNYLEAVVDASPFRAGRLMPGTHTPIVFPNAIGDNPPDYIFILAWNYAQLIRAKETAYRGTWVVPLPDLTFF